jgi:hypothetical protein
LATGNVSLLQIPAPAMALFGNHVDVTFRFCEAPVTLLLAKLMKVALLLTTAVPVNEIAQTQATPLAVHVMPRVLFPGAGLMSP